MITSISNDNQTITLCSQQQDAVNIFDIDSISLLIGNNGSGKTRFLEQIINEFRSSHVGVYNGSCQVRMEGYSQPVSDHETRVWGVIYYSPVPYRLRFRSERKSRIIDASPKSARELPLMKLHDWQDIAAELGIEPKLVAKISIDLAPLIAHIIDAGMQEVTEDWRKSLGTEAIETYRSASKALKTFEDDPQKSLAARQRLKDIKMQCGSELLLHLQRNNDSKKIHSALIVMHHYHKNKKLSLPTMKFVFKECFNFNISDRISVRRRVAEALFSAIRNVLFFLLPSDADMVIKNHILSAEIGIRSLDDAERLQKNNMSDFFKFQFSKMSSGQMALIAHLGLIMDAIEDLHHKHFREILIIIDEGDAFLHLEWQRQYIDILNRVLGAAKKRCSLNRLQLIIATHSPLLATDIPKEFICRLNKTDEGKSNQVTSGFAAPIPLLIHDSFGANTIGEFATKKINQAWLQIVDGQQVDEKTRYIIRNIDNRLLKEEMERLLREKGEKYVNFNRG